MSRYLLALIALVAVVHVSIAEESAELPVREAEDAAPLEVLVPFDNTEDIPFEDVYFEVTEEEEEDAPHKSIREEINVDLIDLRALSRAIQARATPEIMRLTLEDCILIALDRNPDLLITGLEPLKSESDILSAKGEFDPMLQSQATVSEVTSQANQQIAAFGGITELSAESTSWTTSLAGKLKTGTQYSASYVFGKEATTFGAFVAEYDSFVNFTLTQPLLKGFGTKYNSIRIHSARYGHEAAQKQLEVTVLSTMSEVIKAYWDLVGTIENLKVQREALTNAERLLKINETRREIGTAADIEVLQAKAGVATRQSELISARAQIGAAEDRLKLLLDMQSDAYFSTAQIVPLDRPSFKDDELFAPSEFDTMRLASTEKALVKRPEIRLAELEIANSDLDILQRKHDLLPQFDLTLSYGQGGRGPDWGDSLQGTFDRRQDSFTYGFQGAMPLGNRTARGAYVRSQLTKKQSELRLHQTRQQLMFNVHVSVRNVITNRILMESTRQATRLQEVNVIAEEKRLRLGTSTSFEVLRIQSDLTAAQTQQLQAAIAYEKSLVDLEMAEGTLLENRNIVYDQPGMDDASDFTMCYFCPRWKE